MYRFWHIAQPSIISIFLMDSEYNEHLDTNNGI